MISTLNTFTQYSFESLAKAIREEYKKSKLETK